MLLILGDTHADNDIIAIDQWIAKYFNPRHPDDPITHVLQTGDFGISWPGRPCKILHYFLKRDVRNPKENAVPWIFCGGNHDNYTKLKTLGREETGTRTFYTPRVYHVARGHRLQIRDLDIMFIGGAESSDCHSHSPPGWASQTSLWPGRAEYPREWKRRRRDATPPSAWWREESLRRVTSINIGNSPAPDMVISHDCPTRARPWRMTAGKTLGDVPLDQTPKYLDAIYQTWLERGQVPQWWFYGHHHCDHIHREPDTRFACAGIVSERDRFNDKKQLNGYLFDPKTGQQHRFELRTARNEW